MSIDHRGLDVATVQEYSYRKQALSRSGQLGGMAVEEFELLAERTDAGWTGMHPE